MMLEYDVRLNDEQHFYAKIRIRKAVRDCCVRRAATVRRCYVNDETNVRFITVNVNGTMSRLPPLL